MTTIETHVLETPGATVHYDVRAVPGSEHPTLLMAGSPMEASGFTTLASLVTDRTVVTYDPRNVGRSSRAASGDVLLDRHAVIEAVGGPVDVFGSSGGAVNALALVQAHPRDVLTLVAHEPPLADQLPDRAEVLAVCEDIHATYLRDGQGPAMAKFIVLVMQQGPLPDGYAAQPGPDPATFGLPTEDDGRRDDPLLGDNIRTCTPWVPDYDALAAAPTRIVVGYGVGSGEELASRGGRATGVRLGLEPVEFPSHHGGFLGGEFGQQGEPEPFAARLLEVLSRPE